MIDYGNEAASDEHLELHVGRADLELSERGALTTPKAPEGGRGVRYALYPSAQRQQGPKPSIGDAQRALGALLADDLLTGLDLIVYIHGFDTNFVEALWYAAQIDIRYNRMLEALRNSEEAPSLPRVPAGYRVAVFTWPSDGKALRYTRDRQDAEGSAMAAAALLQLCEATTGALREEWLRRHRVEDMDENALAAAGGAIRRGPPAVHLMAQSMGAYVLRLGWQRLLDLRDRQPQRAALGRIVLTGADEDTDIFQRDDGLRRLHEFADHIQVYYNPNDVLGLISGVVFHAKGRISRRGPREPRFLNGLSALNIGPIYKSTYDPIGHYYARMNEGVVRDIVRGFCDVDPYNVPDRAIIERPNHWSLVRT